MNEQPKNSVFSVPRAQCFDHRRDSHGWPLGNCVECRDYRKKMEAWHLSQVLGGLDPEREDHREPTVDRNSAHADGWGWPEQPLQANSQRKTG